MQLNLCFCDYVLKICTLYTVNPSLIIQSQLIIVHSQDIFKIARVFTNKCVGYLLYSPWRR